MQKKGSQKIDYPLKTLLLKEAGDENRTRDVSLGSFCISIKYGKATYINSLWAKFIFLLENLLEIVTQIFFTCEAINTFVYCTVTDRCFFVLIVMARLWDYLFLVFSVLYLFSEFRRKSYGMKKTLFISFTIANLNRIM